MECGHGCPNAVSLRFGVVDVKFGLACRIAIIVQSFYAQKRVIVTIPVSLLDANNQFDGSSQKIGVRINYDNLQMCLY